MKTPFEYDIFISYGQKDRVAAERLHAALEARKLKVWRDKRLTEAPAADFIAQINRAHERSARVLVLWSRASVLSQWVAAEAEKARIAQKIVALSLEPAAALLPFIPAPFNILPTVDISAAILDLEPVLHAIGAEQAEGQPQGVVSLVTAHADIAKLPDTFAEKLYGRDAERAALLNAWDDGQTRIFAFDAMGGAGKTALVYHFVQALKASGWHGARSVFAWSFYSQGSNEDRQTSADDFIKAAFAHFSGGEKAPPRDPHQKGVDLAHLVQAQRSLLILDGLEPLQYASQGGPQSSAQVGGIKDPSVKALLKALADDNPGLCVITTRIRLAELAGAEGVTFRELDEIPLMDAIALLRDLGVEPATPPAKFKLPAAHEFAALTPPYTPPAAYAPRAGVLPAMPTPVAKDLIEAVRELKGHALALTLAGRYLAQHKKGDIRAIRELPDLPQAGKERAPYRVMRAIEIALANRIAEQDAIETPAADPAGQQLALLFFLGLFDRPADRELLPVVFSKAAEDLAPTATDIATAKIDPVPIKRRLHALDEELHSGTTPEWRKQQIEQLKQPLAATQRAVIETRRRVLVRGLFAGMHAIIGDAAKIADALAQLAAQGLVARTRHASIDCHPLVRDYFGARLKELDGETFRAAHGRLYDHYRYAGLPQAFRDPVAYALLGDKVAYPELDSKRTIDSLISGNISAQDKATMPPALMQARPEQLRKAAALICGAEWDKALKAFLPGDEAGMNPLFSAIGHGCAAEREAETWSEVYGPRIKRGNEHFASQKLGLYGQELAALASFFETPFTKPSPGLSAGDCALALNKAGFHLRALGRLEDAAEPMRTVTELTVQLGDFKNAAADAVNLSELLVTIGRLAGEDGAVAEAEAAVAFADRSGDAALRMISHITHADALFQVGSLARAGALFREAEALQKEMQPDLPHLYSLQGYQYCDLLLARGRGTEAAVRMGQIQEDWARRAGWQAILLDDALYGLATARAALADVPLDLPAPQDCAKRSAVALSALRRANTVHHLPRGLLAHAEALWRCGDANAAGEPLREAEAIAKRGPMPLFLADAYLLRARILLSEARTARARTYRDQAAALIEKHGYGRAAPELAVLDAEIAWADNAEGLEAAIAAAIKAIRGEPYRDERTGITIDGGWWGLLPRLEALHPVDELDLAKLRVARDNYNDERDAFLATQEDPPAGDANGEVAEVPTGLVEHILADQDARATVEQVLTQKGAGELDGMKPEEQHDAIREAVYAVLAETLALKAKTAAADPREVPDALVYQVFAHPDAQGLILDLMRQYSLEGAAAELPFETKRFIVGKLKEHGYVKVEEPPAPAAPPPPPPAKKRGWWPFAGG